jgi:hypothetical protein
VDGSRDGNQTTAYDAADELALDAGLDAGSLSDVDAAPACMNLLLNGGFEDKPTCDPWGTGTTSSTAHAGTRACLACATGWLQPRTSIINQTFSPGEHVSFSVWIRAADLQLYGLTASVFLTPGGSGGVVMSNEYQKVTINSVIAPDGGPVAELDLGLQVYAPDGGCLLFDDAVACRGSQ